MFDMSRGNYNVSSNTSVAVQWMQGTWLEISCHHGYYLPNDTTEVYCNSEGRWVPESPECLCKSCDTQCMKYNDFAMTHFHQNSIYFFFLHYI